MLTALERMCGEIELSVPNSETANVVDRFSGVDGGCWCCLQMNVFFQKLELTISDQNECKIS